MTRAPAPAKLNLALVVGPLREDGRHEVTTVMQRIDLCDRVALAPGPTVHVRGFEDDTLVRDALGALASASGAGRGWHARIWKRIPVAAGLGGGSSDAATALTLANATLDRPLAHERLVAVARRLGADVPFFLEPGPQLAEGDGSSLAPIELPQDYWIVLVLPHGVRKDLPRSLGRHSYIRLTDDQLERARAAITAAAGPPPAGHTPRSARATLDPARRPG